MSTSDLIQALTDLIEFQRIHIKGLISLEKEGKASEADIAIAEHSLKCLLRDKHTAKQGHKFYILWSYQTAFVVSAENAEKALEIAKTSKWYNAGDPILTEHSKEFISFQKVRENLAASSMQYTLVNIA